MTAKEMAESIQYDIQYCDEGGFLGIDTELLAEKLIEFANYHREQALDEASKLLMEVEGNDFGLKSAYPLEKII